MLHLPSAHIVMPPLQTLALTENMVGLLVLGIGKNHGSAGIHTLSAQSTALLSALLLRVAGSRAKG